jgi:hypothetical protein
MSEAAAKGRGQLLSQQQTVPTEVYFHFHKHNGGIIIRPEVTII